MNKNYTVIEVDITCIRCGFRGQKTVRREENQQSGEINWICPMCGVEKRIALQFQKPPSQLDAPVPSKIKDSKRYRTNLEGRVEELDSMGNPIKRESKFHIGRIPRGDN